MGVGWRGQTSGNIPSAARSVTHRSNRSQRAGSTCPPLGTLLWWEGKRTTWLSTAMPTQQDGAVRFVQRNESQMLTQRHFGRWTGGSESGLTFSNVDLVCVCFVFLKILFTNAVAFKCTYLTAKTPVFNSRLMVQLQFETTVFCLGPLMQLEHLLCSAFLHSAPMINEENNKM